MRELEAISDPAERFRRAADLIQESRESMEQAGEIRRQAIDEMKRQGMSYEAIGGALGISRQRAYDIHIARP